MMTEFGIIIMSFWAYLNIMNRNTKLAVLLLIGLILILISVLLSGPKPASEPTIKAPPTPTQIQFSLPPQPTPSITNPLKQQLISLTPVRTPEFDLEYLSKSDLFIVTIKKAPYQVSRAKSEEWLRERGFGDFDALNIKWTAERYLE